MAKNGRLLTSEMERARRSVGDDGYEPFHGYELEVPNEQDSERKLCWREYVVRSAMMAMMNPSVAMNPLVNARLSVAMNWYGAAVN